MTLKEINNTLADLGLGALSASQAGELTRMHARETILGRINAAQGGSAEAKAWLAQSLRSVGVKSSGGEPQPSPAGMNAREDGQTQRYTHPRQIRVNATTGVLIFQPSREREGEDSTIMIEAAPPLPGARRGKPKKGERRYDYEQKILLKVMENELPKLAAFLFGYTARVEFSFHGESHAKAVNLEWQQDGERRKVFARVRDTGQMVAVPMDAETSVHTALLVASTLLARYPGMGDGALRHLLSMHGAGFTATQQRPQRATG
jgi:hypothetical protein